MTQPAELNLDIPQGKTWSQVLRWGSGEFTFKPITAAPQLAPLRLTVTAHGVVDGWPVRITNVLGMVQLNDRDFVAKVIDTNTLEIREVVAGETRPVNAAGYSAYASGGYVEYETPVDLSTIPTWRWQGRKSFDAADPAEFDYTTTLTAAGSGIVVDNTAKTVTLQTAAADTAAWTFDTLFHEIEVTDVSGKKPPFAAGRITVLREVVK